MTEMAPIVHVVDDDSSFRTSVARLLKGCGYQVALYESGEHFLKDFPEDSPGCILLDLQLPGLDGLDLQNRLAASGNILPIVFLTGHGDIPMACARSRPAPTTYSPNPRPRTTCCKRWSARSPDIPN